VELSSPVLTLLTLDSKLQQKATVKAPTVTLPAAAADLRNVVQGHYDCNIGDRCWLTATQLVSN